MTGRGHSVHSTTIAGSALLPFINIFILLAFPAFFSCTAEVPLPEAGPCGRVESTLELSCPGFAGTDGSTRTAAGWWLVRSVEVFVFDEATGTLDSYQRSWVHSSVALTLWSGRGVRRVVGIANMEIPAEIAARIGTYQDILQLETTLQRDSPEHPVMYGEALFTAGLEGHCLLPLEPVLCELDLSLKNGLETSLEEICVYLSDVSARTRLFCGSEPVPSEIICAGGIVEKELEAMDYPRMVCSYLIGKVDSGGSARTSLWCYPNPVASLTASLGSPVTSINVDATVNGARRHWSAPLDGLRRGLRYDISLLISR